MKKLTFGCLLSLFAAAALTGCGGNGSGEVKGDTTTTTKDSAAASVTKDWKIGVQLWTFHEAGPFVTSIARTDSAGVKFVEAYPGQPLGGDMKDTFGIRMSPESRAKIKQLLQSKGIQIVAMGVITPKTLDEWKQYFDLAKEFGLSYITAEPLKNQWDGIDSLAGVYGINVAIHDHPRPNAYWHPDSVLAAIKGHAHIGSCADVGHWTRNGLDPVECLKRLEGHVYGVHLKDVDSAGNTKAKDLVVGTGVIKFAPIFEELKRQQFRGMFSIEREGNWQNNVPDVINTVKFFNDQVSKL
ncbi:sugar phosphate isomerase/epimerase family protein [Puia sp. P3]|uniref:sugar phosphate isomerase/epimerase family protein n=1 Tax=Puia sp. P3 TaxID=3423952 RepID=UPI003D66A16C